MAFRTVVIKNRCKLEYSLNYLVCRSDVEKRIVLDEIECIIIQNTNVSITCALLSVLSEKKIKVIFCDGKANPHAELTPYYNNYCSYKKIMQQINFDQEFKDLLWQRIIYQKVYNEYQLLKSLNKENSEKLKEYLNEVELRDITNREGHAAKVYFNSLFGNKFYRDDDKNVINKYLNYGYSILVSLINREIKIFGYLTEIGIHHKGETNSFNLSYDFFEPLRTFVDNIVVKKLVNEDNYKSYFVKMLEEKVMFDGKVMYLDNAIHSYIQSLFIALNNRDLDEVKFIEYEL